MSEKELADLCADCGAKCCRYISLEIDKPTDKNDFDNIRWYLLHRDVHVFVDNEGDWCIEFKARCNNLDEKNMCVDYDSRPKICRSHGDKNNCEATIEHMDELYKHFFANVDEFDDYMAERKAKKKKKMKK